LAVVLLSVISSTSVVEHLAQEHGDFNKCLDIPCFIHRLECFGIMEQRQFRLLNFGLISTQDGLRTGMKSRVIQR
jgi:hypothetical protein